MYAAINIRCILASIHIRYEPATRKTRDERWSWHVASSVGLFVANAVAVDVIVCTLTARTYCS